MGMNAEEIRGHPSFTRDWYHSMELSPGVFTKGIDHRNVALTRELLGSVDVEGDIAGRPVRALDIGTMDGLVPVLLARRGATVAAYDRQLSPGLQLVSAALGVELELFGDMELGSLPDAVAAAGHEPFDLVVLSGVLYHMVDPFLGLAVARGLLRNGGVMLVETLATFDSLVCMHFNVAGHFTPDSVWLPSVPCLDYLLRFLRLEPLDVAHLGPWQKEGGPPFGRIAVACRARSEPSQEPDDPRVAGTRPGDDLNLKAFVDWVGVESGLGDLKWAQRATAEVRRDSGSLDVLQTALANSELSVTLDRVRLKLDAIR